MPEGDISLKLGPNQQGLLVLGYGDLSSICGVWNISSKLNGSLANFGDCEQGAHMVECALQPLLVKVISVKRVYNLTKQCRTGLGND